MSYFFTTEICKTKQIIRLFKKQFDACALSKNFRCFHCAEKLCSLAAAVNHRFPNGKLSKKNTLERNNISLMKNVLRVGAKPSNHMQAKIYFC